MDWESSFLAQFSICVSAALDAQEVYEFCCLRIEEHLKEKVTFEPALRGFMCGLLVAVWGQGYRRSQVANTRPVGPPPCFIQQAPCFYPVAAPSSPLTVKEQLHLYSPKITFGPLKATARHLTPLSQTEGKRKDLKVIGRKRQPDINSRIVSNMGALKQRM